MQNVKTLKFKKDWFELRRKLCLLRQSWVKYLEQNRKTGQEKKSLILPKFNFWKED